MIVFDTKTFRDDVRRAAKELGVKTTRALAAEVGVKYGTLVKMMSRSSMPSVELLLSLCSWAGLDPMAYAKEVEAPA